MEAGPEESGFLLGSGARESGGGASGIRISTRKQIEGIRRQGLRNPDFYSEADRVRQEAGPGESGFLLGSGARESGGGASGIWFLLGSRLRASGGKASGLFRH